MNRIVRALLTDRRGASAAEFAIVLPLMLILLFGIIDAGRYAYSFNRAEKATQVGARFAVVTTPVAPGLAAFDFTTTGVAAGDPILRGTYGPLTCTSTAGRPQSLPGFRTTATTARPDWSELVQTITASPRLLTAI